MAGTSDPNDPLKKAAEGRLQAMRSLGQLGSLGLSFVLAIFIGGALGLWLDGLTGWKPWLSITFFIMGFAAGVLNVYRTISRMK